MATKKPAVKKNKVAAAKKPVKTAKKPTVKSCVVKVATKKIAVKPPKPAAKLVKKSEKKGLAKPMTKVVVDRMTLPKGGKIFVKAAKRPTAKNPAKKAK